MFEALPPGGYVIDPKPGAKAAEDAVLAFALAAYRFLLNPAPAGAKPVKQLVRPRMAENAYARALSAARATWLARDLITMPANRMGPAALAKAARAEAKRAGAEISVITGGDLLKKGWPAVHAVGRAAAEPPRLIDLRWGRETHPKLTLIGKGVTFDTGGLDIKPAGAMKLMKKDMGGAAQILGLAAMVMDAGLPVRLRVLIPAVENSIAGNAMRPLDVIDTRAGLSIEIGHTDAEGRVILADALFEAARERPALMIDCATLTGAARVALGTELPALFCNDDASAKRLVDLGAAVDDPLWRLPLWRPYARHVAAAKAADVTNAPETGFAGAITAALFLERFVNAGAAKAKPPQKTARGRKASASAPVPAHQARASCGVHNAAEDAPPWAHVDLMAYNTSSRPGRPEGGEAMGLRALFALIEDRFGRK
ncbi:MAG: leucyl aminopeptidase family protein [Rhodospirillales bacterium]